MWKWYGTVVKWLLHERNDLSRMAEKKPLMGKDAEVPRCEICGSISKIKLEGLDLCKSCESAAKNARRHIHTPCKYNEKCMNQVNKCASCKAKQLFFLIEHKKGARNNPQSASAESNPKSAENNPQYIEDEPTTPPPPPPPLFGFIHNIWSSRDDYVAGKGRGKIQVAPGGIGKHCEMEKPSVMTSDGDKNEKSREKQQKGDSIVDNCALAVSQSSTTDHQNIFGTPIIHKAAIKFAADKQKDIPDAKATAEMISKVVKDGKKTKCVEEPKRTEPTSEGGKKVQTIPEAPVETLKEEVPEVEDAEEIPPVCELDIYVVEVTPTEIKLSIVPLEEAKWSLFCVSYCGTSPQGVKGTQSSQEFPKGAKYIIDNLMPGYSYTLTVIAKSDSQDECKSNALMVNIPVASVPGQCMFNFVDPPQKDRFVVYWEKASSNGSPIKFYKISCAKFEGPDAVLTATVAPSANPCHTFRNLRPSTSYKVGLEAYNEIGVSAMNYFTFTTASAKNIEMKPHLDLMMPQTKHIGEKLVLKVGIFGAPKPVVQWTKDEKKLASNANVSQSENYCSLEIENVSLSDAGLYTAHVSDETSSVEVHIVDETSSLEHDYQLIEIGLNEDLYHKIVAKMNESMINYQIHKIYKIKNIGLWNKYVSSYKHFEKECGSPSEKILFYGYPLKESLLKLGFDHKLVSKSDKYGIDHAVFCFAETAAAANECAFDEKKCEHQRSGKTCFECMRYMFMARVVLGRQRNLEEPMILPKSGAYYHGISTKPKDKRENEILIANGEQAYSDVLIEYVMCEN